MRVQAQLYLAKLALSKGLKENIGAKFWDCAVWMGSGVCHGCGMLLDVEEGLRMMAMMMMIMPLARRVMR